MDSPGTEGGSLLIRNVEIAGRPNLDVRIADGWIREIGTGLNGRNELDGRGGALIPGLTDHHIHLLSLEAALRSVRLENAQDFDDIVRIVQTFAGQLQDGAWIRAVGYHERIAGPLGLPELDIISPRHPIRIQHQTGALWMLNSLALRSISTDGDPDCVEKDEKNRPTGRIWRGDHWLRRQLGATRPNFCKIGKKLAGYGITSLTDASVTNDDTSAAILADARRRGDLPQHLMMMSGGELARPPDGAFEIGPVKIILDEANLLPIDSMCEQIRSARRQGRAVAVHCVTYAELAFTLAAFVSEGTQPGDRLEHGALIPWDAIPVIKSMNLTVVTQSAFIFERGARYLSEISPEEIEDLYRCRSLRDAGIGVAGSSDAPYTEPNPWVGMRSAVERRATGDNRAVGSAEGITSAEALSLYLTGARNPGGEPRRVTAGGAADLCLLNEPIRDALPQLSEELVAATIVSGHIVFTT